MKIALIGYGRMGKLIERLAVEGGHEISAVISSAAAGITAEAMAEKLKGSDAAIEFTVADAVRRNVEAAVAAGVPIVVGTTGWASQRDELEHIVTAGDGAMVYGANFSVGVNIFYRVVGLAAELIEKFPEYEAFIEEQHHSRKKDSPSGTALKLQEIVSDRIFRERGDGGERVPVAATRAGNIPGTHRVGFDGPADQIELTHTARNREGFARGAITAAEWIAGNKGLYDFSEVIDVILSGRK